MLCGFDEWNVCFLRVCRIDGVYDPTLRFEMRMVKVVYRRHVSCAAVSHARGFLDEAGEVDIVGEGDGSILRSFFEDDYSA